jgi:hypothetical protein
MHVWQGGMVAIIIFYSDDRGPLMILPDRVRRLPNFPKSISQQLKSIYELLHSSIGSAGASYTSITQIQQRLSNEVIGIIEDLIGPLDKAGGLIYEGDEYGFVCGADGRPAELLVNSEKVNPNTLFKEIEDYDHSIFELIRNIPAEKGELVKLFDNPKSVAEKLNITLTDEAEKKLLSLGSKQLGAISEPRKRKFLQYYHSVIKDGKYLDTWLSKPVEVANALNIELDDDLHDDIIRTNDNIFNDAAAINPITIVGVAILGVITATVALSADVTKIPDIRDFSGLEKL